MSEPILYPSIVRPTRVRYGVLAFLGVLALVFYVDRLCIGQAALSIQEDLEISKDEMGWIFSAFTLAYCLFEVPTGAWSDRYGSRGVLTRIVLWWSAFTALTGAAAGFWSLLSIRFLFGAGEAGAFPNTARVLTRWFPPDRRGPAQGLINTLALIGGAVAPVAAAYLIKSIGWRWTFLVFALPGLLWAVAFYWWFRDDPAEHPMVNEAERDLIMGSAPAPGGTEHPPIPWRAVVQNANVWLLGSVLACAAFNTYLFFFWYPSYLNEARGTDPITTGWLAGLVLCGGAAGAMSGGILIDWLIRRTGQRRRCRCGLGFSALASAATLLLLGAQTDATLLSTLWMAAGMFAINATLANWWGAATDVSGRHVGALFGLMNAMGGLGAVMSPPFLGRFVQYLGSLGYEGRAQWTPAFFVYAGVLLVGAFGWLLIDTTRPVQAEAPVTSETA
ncbi:MAG TPA: MFS transporter [Gemmataceae bacterium]|nr:MFS transporter [Gemmataceae bacterium]